MIGAKVASMILDSRELNFYKVWLGLARLSIMKACHQRVVLPCPSKFPYKPEILCSYPEMGRMCFNADNQ